MHRLFLLHLPSQQSADTLFIETDLLPKLPLGVNDQLASVVTDTLLELHYGLIRLPPIPGTVHLICLAISAVTGSLFNQANLQHHRPIIVTHSLFEGWVRVLDHAYILNTRYQH